MSERPCALVLVAPSGTGKTTVARALLAESDDYSFSVSATTRSARAGERDGVDYHFVDRERFGDMARAGRFAEWAEVHGQLYGTPLQNFAAARERGQTLILDIDFQGALQVMRVVPDAASLFLLPPSGEVLLSRLEGRGTESPAEVRRRLETALDELRQADHFPHWLVNDRLEDTVASIRGIVEEAHLPGRSGALERLIVDVADAVTSRLKRPERRGS